MMLRFATKRYHNLILAVLTTIKSACNRRIITLPFQLLQPPQPNNDIGIREAKAHRELLCMGMNRY